MRNVTGGTGRQSGRHDSQHNGSVTICWEMFLGLSGQTGERELRLRVALDPERDLHLHALDAGHLFEVNVTRLGLRRGAWLRGYAYDFMQRFVPTLTREVIAQTLQGNAPAV